MLIFLLSNSQVSDTVFCDACNLLVLWYHRSLKFISYYIINHFPEENNTYKQTLICPKISIQSNLNKSDFHGTIKVKIEMKYGKNSRREMEMQAFQD